MDSGAAKSVWPSRKKGVKGTKLTRTVNLAAATGSPTRVEGNARLEFVRDGKKCSLRFLDPDVERPLASVSTIVDEGIVVVFGQHGSFIENTNTGQRIPMSRRNGVFVMRLDAQPICGVRRGEDEREDVGFLAAAMTNNSEEIRGRCKTKANIKVREEAGVAKIDGVDEDENEETEGREAHDEQAECWNRKVVRKHVPR